jgi:hypothetical protein
MPAATQIFSTQSPSSFAVTAARSVQLSATRTAAQMKAIVQRHRRSRA